MDNNGISIFNPKRGSMKAEGRPAKLGNYNCDINSVAYDQEGKYLAIGASDGSIKLFNAHTNKPHSLLNTTQSVVATSPYDDGIYPLTCLRWKPTNKQYGDVDAASSILATASSNGLIQHFDVNSNRAIESAQITTHRDSGSNINILDYTCDGSKLLAAGEDKHVHVYDDSTCQLITSMHDRGLMVPGHINRIFGLRSHPDNSNVVVSGGWDGMLKLYDLRDGRPFASIGGPMISGDSIDIFDDMIVTGSMRNKSEMQMFSLSKQKLIHSWDFNPSAKENNTGYVLSTKFSNDGNFIFAGGAGKNDIRIFQNNCDTTADYKLQMEIKELKSAVFTIAVNPNPEMKQFTFGCSNGQVMMINYEVDESNADFEPYQGNFQQIAHDLIEQEEALKKSAKKTRYNEFF